ncbi:MAG: SH3 domain-containing protein [Oligoflexia bacterium]|nr:SH3 domain-containing protein [Oligoflexia bacterium]
MKSKVFLCLGFLLSSSSVFASSHDVEVTASALNVRETGGAILCTIPRGTKVEAVGKHADGERVKIKMSAPGCPSEGYVYSNYVRPIVALEVATSPSVSGLALRSAPTTKGKTLECRINPSNGVTILPDKAQYSDEVTWVKVRTNTPGCPSEGYVAKFYLKPVDLFSDLEIVEGTTTEDCVICESLSKGLKLDGAGGALQKFSRDLGNTLDGKSLDKAQALAREARNAASRCRAYAPHVCKRRGKKHPCGSSCSMGKSKGWCKAGVREAAEKALGFTIPSGAANTKAVTRTLSSRMTKLNVQSCAAAPVGAICQYTGGWHGFGHIEVKAGKSQYCSDYCAAAPIRGRTFMGAYFP